MLAMSTRHGQHRADREREGDDDVTSVDNPDAPAQPDGHPGDLRRLARGSALNLAGSFFAASVNLVLPVIITRSLTQRTPASSSRRRPCSPS